MNREKKTNRRRAPLALAMWLAILVSASVAVPLVIVKLTRDHNKPPSAVFIPLPARTEQAATSVSPLVFDKVGPNPSTSAELVGPKLSDDESSTGNSSTGKNAAGNTAAGKNAAAGGKPKIFYVGGEFCPYCATEQWVLVVAASRFGKFSDLGYTSSSPDEALPSIQTFSLDGSQFESRYFDLDSTEEYGNAVSVSWPPGFPTLTNPDQQASAALSAFDPPPSGSSSPELPFLDIGGQVVMIGDDSGVSPAVMQGFTMFQMATALSDPTNPISQQVVGAANDTVAAICSVTDEQPAKVCDSSGTTAAAKQLDLSR